MFVRVYSREDGQAGFEDLEVPSGPNGLSPLQAAKYICFYHQEPGTIVDFHTTPEPSFFTHQLQIKWVKSALKS